MCHRLRPRRSLILACAILGSLTSTQAQAILYVDADATGAGDGTSWEDAYTDLQLVLEAVPPPIPAEVWVAEGEYLPGPPGAWEATFQLMSGVALYGGFAGVETSREQRDWGAHETILSGDIDHDDVGWYPSSSWNGNQDNVFHVLTTSGTDSTAILDGFTVERGASNYGSHSIPQGDLGSGMYNLDGSPRVVHCIFRWNTASFGGAVYNAGGSPRFTSCSFTQNLVWWYRGGGMCNTGLVNVTLTDCTFTGNVSGGGTGHGGGAGLFNDWDTIVQVVRCAFSNNTSKNFYSMGDHDGAYGAGIYNLADGMVVVDSWFRDNLSNAGSGIYSWGADGALVQCVFAGNTAIPFPGSAVDRGDYGGGLALRGSAQQRTTTLLGCVFVDNSAGEGGGIAALGHAAQVRNCILWDNIATGEETNPIDGQVVGDFDAAYSCIEALLAPIPGEDPPDPADFPGCFDDDPLLVDLPGFDLRLSPVSPCIDAGDNLAVPAWITTDLDGHQRFFDDPATPDTGNGTGPIVDMGAYEFGGGTTAVASRFDEPAMTAAIPAVRVSPNPVSGPALIRYALGPATTGERAVLGIFDVQGRLIRRLPLPAGERRGGVAWDGRDAVGRLLSNGVYFILPSSAPDLRPTKIVVVR